MLKDFNEIVEQLNGAPKKTISVAVPETKEIMLALQRAYETGFVEIALAGEKSAIDQLRADLKLDFPIKAMVDTTDEHLAAMESAKYIAEGKAQVLMKGNLKTSTILSALLNKDFGLRTDRPLSHVFILESKPCGRLLFVTDSAVNIAPDFQRKVDILQNAIDFVRRLGYQEPKAAVLAAVEYVTPKMPVTEDAAKLEELAKQGKITGAKVVGPFALDDALSEWVCKEKNITGPVQGDADILLVPDIECGNMLSKSQTFLAGGPLAGIAVGAKVPMVLNSRADNVDNRFYAIAAACLAA
jgi:phosphotransacetylase